MEAKTGSHPPGAASAATDSHPRRRRSDGERSRRRILQIAARLATVEGIEGLSLGRLAEEAGMSKSGLYAHFGSKEDLQLATVDTAIGLFNQEVIAPGLDAPEGRARIEALGDAFLDHLEREVFPGGCFFISVAAEMSVQPGAVRDRVAEVQRGWIALYEQNVRAAQAQGEIADGIDVSQLAFELVSYLTLANGIFALSGDTGVLDRARRALRARLDAAAPPAGQSG